MYSVFSLFFFFGMNISYYAKKISVYIFQLFIEAKKEEETLY